MNLFFEAEIRFAGTYKRCATVLAEGMLCEDERSDSSSRFLNRDLRFFPDLGNMLFNRFGFFPQVRQMLLQPGDSLFSGHKSRPQIWRLIASAETDILMTPSLKSVMTGRRTTHGFTSSHIYICKYSHILIFWDKKNGASL